ncbi:hypothetical protein [Lysobacter gummosus]|uniref:hypothetical protein n=1 Tax=Lysobacter gummosus TaxID=262324 RepID=UPI00362D4DEF
MLHPDLAGLARQRAIRGEILLRHRQYETIHVAHTSSDRTMAPVLDKPAPRQCSAGAASCAVSCAGARSNKPPSKAALKPNTAPTRNAM